MTPPKGRLSNDVHNRAGSPVSRLNGAPQNAVMAVDRREVGVITAGAVQLDVRLAGGIHGAVDRAPHTTVRHDLGRVHLLARVVLEELTGNGLGQVSG